MSGSGFSAALRGFCVLGLALLAACAVRPTEEDYVAYQVALRAMGDLRTERTPADAPFTRDDLIRNFERIALRHEADASVPASEANWQSNPLMRWEGPLNYRLLGSAATDEDRAEVRRLMHQISRLTGLEIIEADSELNFLILITTPSEREHYAEQLGRLNPALKGTFDFWRRTASVICVANNLFSGTEANRIVAGLVAIGSETTGLLRKACLHEEIVQALGLANDHPEVRPSIFNDDSEFALLTAHDELLLRILYDPRLHAGMTADQAMPAVRRIVAGLDIAQDMQSASLPDAADESLIRAAYDPALKSAANAEPVLSSGPLAGAAAGTAGN